jgi:archaellum component FlaC
MEDLSSRIQVDPSTRETTMFKARIAALSSQDNSEYLLSKERGIIRDRINKINEEIIRIENNMAFFGNSKNASDMLKEYQEKIESLKKEIETQKEKLKLFPKANKA